MSIQRKGFVYKLLVSRASNSLCARFQELTKRQYNENIIVNNKKKISSDGECVCWIVFFWHSYDGYIVWLPENINLCPSKTFLNENLQQLNMLLKKAYQAGKTFDKLREKIWRMFNVLNKGNNCIMSDENLMCWSSLTRMRFFNNM